MEKHLRPLVGVRRMILLVTVLGIGWPVAAWAQTADAEKELRASFGKAMALQRQGQYREALPYYQKALDLAPSVFGKDDLNTAVIQNNLANLYLDVGQYANAEPLY